MKKNTFLKVFILVVATFGAVSAMSRDEVVIRYATESDIPAVYKMIIELAKFEKKDISKLPITEEKLRKHGFGEKRYFKLAVAEVAGVPVGYALYLYTFRGCEAAPILYVEDLYVAPEQRHKGIGTELLSFLAARALEEKIDIMEWNVFTWNEPAIQFFSVKLGGKLRRDLFPVQLRSEQMVQLAQTSGT